MKNLFDSHWERVRFTLTPAKLRIGLAMLSIVALALGGSAELHWS